MTLFEIILPPGSTSADLQTAVDNAALGDTIVISSDMPFTNTVTIPEGKEITIESDPDNIGVMSSPGAKIRHFIVNGSLVLQNITIDGGKVGGGIQNNGTLTMNTGAIIQNCYYGNTGGGVHNNGTFNMLGGTISGNTATIEGGGVCNNGTFNMLGGTISSNTAIYGGGVGNITYGANNSGTFTMSDGEISDNTASVSGGGVINYDMFTMSGGEISSNTAMYGGGVYLGNTATFSAVNNSKITGNTASREGGGVCNQGTFTMSDGEISGNMANNGGGVFNDYNNATFIMYNGTISNNSSSYGGGVYNGITFNMAGGIISGNMANSGGGVYVHLYAYSDNDSIFTMNSGKISGNEASTGNGGGVFLSNNCNLSITGQSYIVRNFAPNGNGGGIYIEDTTYGSLTTGSDTIFCCNRASAAYAPPADAAELYPNIKFASTSITEHPLNNFDINYTGGEPIDVFFNVNYNANGGIGSYTGPNTVPGGTDTVLSVEDTGISRGGYTFTGWNTEPDGSGTEYEPGDTVTLDSGVTLYAQWTVAQEYTVIYNANGGNGSHTDSERQYGTYYTILLPTQTGITRPGYTFTGWNTEPDGSGLSFSPGDIITITGNVTLYAQWRENTESKPKRICPKPVTKCRTAVEGRKIWVDDDNTGNTRPDTIEILLLRDGEVYKRTFVDSENDWAFGFCCLPVWKNSGNKYIYKIDEADVSGYTKTIEGYNVTNTLTP